jgi:hypothetical protein
MIDIAVEAMRARVETGMGRPLMRECYHDRDKHRIATYNYDIAAREAGWGFPRWLSWVPMPCVRCWRWRPEGLMYRVSAVAHDHDHNQWPLPLCSVCWREGK